MKKQALFYVFAFLISCTPLPKKNIETFQANEHNLVDEQIIKWRALNAYVGKYSKETDFFKNKLVKTELKKILNDDYNAYLNFVESAGCCIVEKLDDIIYCDISMEHVGGYNSMILINTVECKMYLFWLKGSVRKKDYQIYGKLPIPEIVKKIIVDDMNSGWGHIAEFVYKKNDSLLISIINLESN